MSTTCFPKQTCPCRPTAGKHGGLGVAIFLCLFSKRLLMIPRCCPLISELQLTGCFKVTDAVMAMVVDELRLQRFAISSSSNIANKTLAALAKQTGSLMGCFVLCFGSLHSYARSTFTFNQLQLCAHSARTNCWLRQVPSGTDLSIASATHIGGT